MEAILADFNGVVLPRVSHWNHPHFHAYFSVSSSGPGILGELLTAALNVNAMLWKSCPAATELEQITASWVLQWLDLPGSWFGMILDSASTAVLHAIVAARQRIEPQSRSIGPSGNLTSGYKKGRTRQIWSSADVVQAVIADSANVNSTLVRSREIL